MFQMFHELGNFEKDFEDYITELSKVPFDCSQNVCIYGYLTKIMDVYTEVVNYLLDNDVISIPENVLSKVQAFGIDNGRFHEKETETCPAGDFDLIRPLLIFKSRAVAFLLEYLTDVEKAKETYMAFQSIERFIFMKSL